MAVDFLLDSMELVGESLTSVLALHGENVLKSLLLAAQDLNLLLMSVEVLVERAAGLGQVCQLTLEMSSVLRTLHLACCGLAYN